MSHIRQLVLVLAVCLMTLILGCGGTGPGNDDDPVGCLEATPSQRTVSSSSGSTTFSISNSCDGTMNWSASESCDWISLSGSSGSNSGTITASYSTNSSESGRVCTITVNAPEASGSPKHVTITQDGQGPAPCLLVHSSWLGFWCGSGSTSIDVSNPCGGTMNWHASVSGDWVTLSGNSGVNSGIFGVHYSANPDELGRNCTITVTAPGASGSPFEVDVYQDGGPCGF